MYLLLLLLPVLVLTQSSPTICSEPGVCYQGSWATTYNGTRYASFQGIRYAQPPIGELRFKPPQPYIAGEAVWDVSGESDVVCPQLGFDGDSDGVLKGKEDCLLLNIYVPGIAFTIAQDPLPVMVWIHGGSLLSGSNRFDEQGPQHFLDRKVIIVTANYRLGPLGFLTMGTQAVPGNTGLRDQSLALAWVGDNIASFGGDPGAVTIFGESAGSLSVSLHLISPLSVGLFHRAILQSGDAINPSWGPITPEHALQYADMFSKALSCDQEEDVLVCLQGRDVAEVVALTDLVGDNTDGAVWMAVPDIDFTTNPFLPGYAEQLMESGDFNTEVEVILGTNADEGIIFMLEQLKDPSLWDNYRENFDIIGPKKLFNIVNASDITAEDVENAHRIVEYYVGSMDNINEDHKQGIFDMYTDAGFLYGTHKTISYLLERGVTVYQYILTYEGQYSFTQRFGIDPVGVCHLDDLFYLWDTVPSVGPLSGDDVSVREVMTLAWANFAAYGDPTPPGSGLSWTPVVPDSLHQYWNISGPMPVMATSQEIQERMELWEKVVG